MSEIMLLGILRMPLPDSPADMGVMEWMQVKDRMWQAADELEKARAELEGHLQLIEVLEEQRDAVLARAEAAERERDEARKTLNDLHERQMKLVADRDAAIREVSAAGRRQGEAEARMDAAIAERNTCWSDFGAVCEVLGNCEAEIAVDRAKSMQADLVEARNELDAVYNALGTADAEGAPDAAATIAILFKECSAAVCERDEAREAADALRETIKMETELQGQLQGELAAAEAKVAKLREALTPFAEICDAHDIPEGERGEIETFADCADLCRARTALQETEQ